MMLKDIYGGMFTPSSYSIFPYQQGTHKGYHQKQFLA